VSNIVSQHADAYLSLLRGNMVLADKVFDGAVPSPTPAPPYVVVYVHQERLPGADGNTMDGLSATVRCRAICHCVGADATAARAMAYQVSAALLDVEPTITGRTCSPIHHESNMPPNPDESTGTLVTDQVDTYRFDSWPA
jgi:hypothetical protein